MQHWKRFWRDPNNDLWQSAVIALAVILFAVVPAILFGGGCK